MSNPNTVDASGISRSCDSAVEQRRDRRIPTELDVELTWIDAFGFESSASAVVKDISARGLGIQSPERRPGGSRLNVASGENSMRCVVRHVRSVAEGFYLGLEILPSFDEIAKARESLENLRTELSRR